MDGAGLLRIDEDAQISRFAVFVSGEEWGTTRQVTVHAGAGVMIRSEAIAYADVQLGSTPLVATTYLRDHRRHGAPRGA